MGVFDGTKILYIGMGHGRPPRRFDKVRARIGQIQHLITFALPDRIVTHRRHAVAREQDAGALVTARSLAVMAMPDRHDHRGPRRRRLREVEIRRDMKPRPAFEDDLFDAIALALQRADQLWIQRRAVWQTADLLQEKCAAIRRILMGDCMSETL